MLENFPKNNRSYSKFFLNAVAHARAPVTIQFDCLYSGFNELSNIIVHAQFVSKRNRSCTKSNEGCRVSVRKFWSSAYVRCQNVETENVLSTIGGGSQFVETESDLSTAGGGSQFVETENVLSTIGGGSQFAKLRVTCPQPVAAVKLSKLRVSDQMLFCKIADAYNGIELTLLKNICTQYY